MSEPLKRWQNLLHKKCPKCNERLVQFKDIGILFRCSDEACGFIISQKAMVDIFNDETHIMRRFLDDHERELLEAAIARQTLEV